MSDSQCFIVGIIFSVVVLAFTFSKTHSDESDFKWAVEFCGGKDKIKNFTTNGVSTVMCVDSRQAEIP